MRAGALDQGRGMIPAHENDNFANVVLEAVIVRSDGRPPSRGEIKFQCPCGELHRNGDAHCSASYNVDKRTWRCVVCGMSGGLIDLSRRLDIPLPGSNGDAPARPRVQAVRPAPRPKVSRGRVVKETVYECRDAAGALVAEHRRLDYADGSKDCLWFRDGKPGLQGLSLPSLPLYASEKLATLTPGTRVVITEGEPACAALWARGIPAVASVTGWQLTPSAESLAVLKGFRVALWADADPPDADGTVKGTRHMEAIGARLRDLDVPLTWVSWPAAPSKGDAANFMGSDAELLTLLDTAPAWPLEDPQPGRANVPQVEEFPNGGSVIAADALIQWDPEPLWPELPSEALYGLAGDVVLELQQHTEASTAALLLTLLAGFGNAVGAGPHARVGGCRHPARLFVLLIGRTGRGRKGQSYADVSEVLQHADPTWWQACQAGGLASGEGLVARVRDSEDGSPRDKRAMVYEPEYARLLQAKGREGNTLGALLRDAWDRGDLYVSTRKDPLVARDAHVSILSHVTPEELRTVQTRVDAESGFSNRFLHCLVRRRQKLPSGGNLSRGVVQALASRLGDVIRQARTRELLMRTPACEAVWDTWYRELPEDVPGLFGALTQRVEAHVLRLSLTFALLDGAAAIDLPHLQAAHAVWSYVEASTRYVFGQQLGHPTAERLLARLRAIFPEGLDGEEQHDLFSRNRGRGEVEAARRLLIDTGLAEEGVDRTGKPGRPSLKLYACVRSTKQTGELPALRLPAGTSAISSLRSCFSQAESDHDGTAVRVGDDGMVAL